MGLFQKLFPKPQAKAVDGYFQTLTGYTPVFTTFSGGVYEAQITRAAIHAIATHASKLKPEVKNNEQLARLLQHRPNPWQNTSQFLYRVATIFAVDNNAFIVPIYDEYFERIIGYYPILPSMAELVDHDGEPWLRYTFSNGAKAAIEFSKVGVLTQFQYQQDFFGENNAPLRTTLQLIDTQNQGIELGIKNSAAIRFMAKLGNSLRPDDIEAERERFVKSNFGAANNGGVMMFDTKYAEVKQIISKPYIVDADQMKAINDSVYNYFGVNEKILRNEWDEDDYTAFYEGKIEPFAVQLGLAMTNMTYSDRAIAFGNEIMFSSNRLQYASTSAKLQVTQTLLDRGIISRNQACDIWQLPHIEGGDDYVIRGEYMSADNATKAPREVKPEEPEEETENDNDNE